MSVAVRSNDSTLAPLRLSGRGTPEAFVEFASPHEIGERLLRYLRRRWHLRRLVFAREPEAILHGWETYTFRFQVAAPAGLPVQYARPLILRIYASGAGTPCAYREWQIENYLAPLGYPVATCVLLERCPDVFGGPFLISEQAPGQPFPDYLFRHPWRIVDLPRQMGRLHAALHRLPVDPDLLKATSFLDRQLSVMERLIRDHDLHGLENGLAWLMDHRPEENEQVILHLDFHPLNLLYDGARGFTVLDWSQVDVGERYADCAVAKMFMDCMQIERPGLWARLNFWGGRLLLRAGYRAGYEKSYPLNPDRLAYYSGWASLRRLCMYGAWLKAGPGEFGSKPASLGKLTQAHIDSFCQHFERHTGEVAHLDARSCLRETPHPDKSIVASSPILG
jgi:aminoglycoside phosphotransferase (APT) family kinase protein